MEFFYFLFLLRRLLEKYRETCEYLHMVLIDLEISYDRVPKEVMQWFLAKKKEFL